MRQISSGAQLRVNLIMEWVSCGQAKQTLGWSSTKQSQILTN
jgi:hypothetical protein